MGDGLGLNGGVHRNPLEAALLDRSGVDRNTDCRRQNRLHAFGTDTLAPARHRAGIDRQAMLKKIETAEILPVGVLDPALYSLLVGQIVHVLQIVQPDHQARWLGRTAQRPVVPAKGLIEFGPGHQGAQAYQLMLCVDDGIKAFAKEVGVSAVRLLGLHENLPENEGYKHTFWHFPIFDSLWESLLSADFRVFQGELFKIVRRRRRFLPGMAMRTS